MKRPPLLRSWLLFIFFDLSCGILFSIKNFYSLVIPNFSGQLVQYTLFSEHPLWNYFLFFSLLHIVLFLFLSFSLLRQFFLRSSYFPASMSCFCLLHLFSVFLNMDQLDFFTLYQADQLSPEAIGHLYSSLFPLLWSNALLFFLISGLGTFLFLRHLSSHIPRWFFFSLLFQSFLNVVKNHLFDFLSLDYLTHFHWITTFKKNTLFLSSLFSLTREQLLFTKSMIWIPYLLLSKRVRQIFTPPSLQSRE